MTSFHDAGYQRFELQFHTEVAVERLALVRIVGDHLGDGS